MLRTSISQALLCGFKNSRAHCVSTTGPSQSWKQANLATSATQEQVGFVAGASRGLGLEYVRQLLERPKLRVIAGCRNPSHAEGLKELESSHPDRLEVVQLDITDEESIQRAASHVSSHHQHLDLLINAAGILHSSDMSPETALSRVQAKDMLTNYRINAMGPILVSKAFAPLLVNAAKVNGASSEKPAVIASMSARVGSIGDNSIGGWHSYRASKTALNQLNKCMSIEFGRRRQMVACIVLHPGTVDTELSKPFQKNVAPEKLFSKERAIRQLLEIIDKTTMDDNGCYIAWDGQTIPW